MEKDGRLFGLEREQISLGYWVKREQETTAAAALSVGGAQPGPGGGGSGNRLAEAGNALFPSWTLLGSSRVPLASPPLPPMFQNPPKLRGPAQPLPDSEPPQRPRPLSPLFRECRLEPTRPRAHLQGRATSSRPSGLHGGQPAGCCSSPVQRRCLAVAGAKYWSGDVHFFPAAL